MITEYEDYCSYEVAKLLKEKGFDKPCACCYKDGNLKTIWHDTFGEVRPQDWNNLSQEEYNCNGLSSWFGCISAPTHQEANRWLRENHHLWIDIDPLTGCKWTWSVWFMNGPNQKLGESLQTISKYEEAEDTAIKYCLENLI